MTITEQPAPTVTGHPPIADLVCRDLGAQPHLGGHRIGVRARIRERATLPGGDPLRDLENNILDGCQHAKQAVLEREVTAPTDPDLPALRALYGDLLEIACAIRQMSTSRQQVTS